MHMTVTLKKLFEQARKSALLLPLLITHVIFVLLFALQHVGFFSIGELILYDTFLDQKVKNNEIDDRITMVWISDEDQIRFGQPITDDLMANLFENLLQYQPRVIGLDIYRDLPVPIEKTAGYHRLTNLFKQNKNIIGIEKFIDARGVNVGAPEILKKNDQIGFNDVIADGDGKIRRGLLFISDKQRNKHSIYFGLRLAMEYLSHQGIYLHNDEENNLILGETPLPLRLTASFGGYNKFDTGGYQFLIQYINGKKTFNSLTLSQILDNKIPPELVKDKILIIGSNAEATPDLFYTPIHHSRYAGAAIHGQVVSQLLHLTQDNTKTLASWSNLQEYVWIWFWGLLGALLALIASSIIRFSLLLLSGVALILVIAYTAFLANWWLLGIAPIVAWLANMAIITTYLSYKEKQQRATLMNLFRRHVSSDVADVIWNEREQYLTNGRLRAKRITATVLFTDLQNFTTVSEQMSPEDLMTWLNNYMQNMVEIVEAHDGQVNKFIGDAVMAVFGAPIPSETEEAIQQDAENAIKCALAMRERINELQQQWMSEQKPILRMRVGIATGTLVAGSLGSTERQEYTVIGDTVNIASRLESFDKTLDAFNNCRIFISESTHQNLPEGLYPTMEIGSVNLKGKEDITTIYQV